MRKDWNEALQTAKSSYMYRSKWACFSCQTAFARARDNALDKVSCPSCRKTSTDMGYLFEPPKRSDNKSWKIMQELAQSNFTFHTAGRVAFIQFKITNDGKASLADVRRNIKAHGRGLNRTFE